MQLCEKIGVKQRNERKCDVRKVLMSVARIVVDGIYSDDGSRRVKFVDSSYGQTSVMIGTAIQSHIQRAC